MKVVLKEPKLDEMFETDIEVINSNQEKFADFSN